MGVLRSKATGEPSYSLAASAHFAAKYAVKSARADAGNTGSWRWCRTSRRRLASPLAVAADRLLRAGCASDTMRHRNGVLDDDGDDDACVAVKRLRVTASCIRVDTRANTCSTDAAVTSPDTLQAYCFTIAAGETRGTHAATTRTLRDNTRHAVTHY